MDRQKKKQWLISNGIGGYSSSSGIGLNTSKYHGLLIASLKFPGDRNLILSKIDEAITINNKEYILYSNKTKNSFSDGYKCQTDFKLDIIPTFKYEVDDIKITKQVYLVNGENSVIISYEIVNFNASSAFFTAAPLINFRPIHEIVNYYPEYSQSEIETKNNKTIKLGIKDKPPIYMYCNTGDYIKHDKDYFIGMYYEQEENRGYECVENHIVPGVFKVEIEPTSKKEFQIIVSLEKKESKIDIKKLTKVGEQRRAKIVKNAKPQNEMQEALLKVSDTFLVENEEAAYILAGFPWFNAWNRDALISFEGLLLITNRYGLARKVLLTITKSIVKGMVPNGYNEKTLEPLLNSADASLLLFEATNKYLEYTRDYDFVITKVYPVLKKIFNRYSKRTAENINLDKDGLIVAGNEFTQLTWMDAKVDGVPVTPRNGKTVEINALWYNALCILTKISKKVGEPEKVIDKYEKYSLKCKDSFYTTFYNPKKKYLNDTQNSNLIRPNALFSIALSYPVITNSKIAELIIRTAKKKLFTVYGLKTLASDEEGYKEKYEGDQKNRDLAYHQGTIWPWLLALYFKGCQRANISNDIILKEKEAVLENFRKEMEKGCLDSICEVYDAENPTEAKGAWSQAWSVAAILELLSDKQEERE